MGFGFDFLFKKKNEMQELLNEDNIIMDGNFECTEFISLKGGNPEYIYCEEFTRRADDDKKFVEELAVRSGVDREKAKEYAEYSLLSPKIYMNKKGNFEFVLEFDCSDEIDWVMTDKEKEMLIRKASDHFRDCFGTDLMKLPEMVKGCKSVEQLYDKFEIERGKGLEKVVEAYNFEKMKVQLFDKEKFDPYVESTNKILVCTFCPDKKTSAELCKEAGIQENSNVECTAKFDNHMQMTLEVNNGSEAKTIVPKHSLEKEIRAGISAMYEKKLGYSLAEYMFKECPSVYYAKPTPLDMEYYCREMRKQNFFNEEMKPDFYNEERLKDWALDMLCDYQNHNLSPLELHRELDYYNYPYRETRLALLEQLREYKERYEQYYSNDTEDIDYDDIEVPF